MLRLTHQVLSQYTYNNFLEVVDRVKKALYPILVKVEPISTRGLSHEEPIKFHIQIHDFWIKNLVEPYLDIPDYIFDRVEKKFEFAKYQDGYYSLEVESSFSMVVFLKGEPIEIIFVVDNNYFLKR